VSNKSKPRRPEAPAYKGDETPMHPDEVSIGPLEKEMGETPELVSQGGDDRTVVDAELPAEQRHSRGIEDNVRHVSSIGRR
jgi:hypothetical protein